MLSIRKQTPSRGLDLVESPRPTIQSHEALIKIKKTAICGTDVHIYNWDTWAQQHLSLPRIIGHECVGEIKELGTAIQGLTQGDIVSVEGHLFCGECQQCKQKKYHLCEVGKGVGMDVDGAFCEYMKVPFMNIRPIKPTISLEDYCLMDPFGNAVHAVFKANVKDQSVLITGAGPIGIYIAMICQHLGASRVILTDLSDYRLDLARQQGIQHTINSSHIAIKDYLKDVKLPYGVNIGFEVSGSSVALQEQLSTLRKSGHLILIGLFKNDIPLDLSQIILQGLKIDTIFGREIFKTWEQAEQLIQDSIHPSALITHHINPKDYNKAFQWHNNQTCGKIMMDWE